MAPDEVAVLVVSLVIGAVRWALWYGRAGARSPFLSSHGARWPLYLGPPVCAGALLIVLAVFAAGDVRDSAPYIIFYMAIGAAWVSIAAGLAPLFGLRALEDVAERRNRAAGHATIGVLLGLTLAFAGANIGDGPGWWVVLFSAALSTAGFFLAWTLVDLACGVTDMVTIDRDRAAGVRLAAYLVSVGAIQGRAVAGTWVSASATVTDWLVAGWPVLGLALLEAVIGRMHGAVTRRETPSVAALGLVPGALYLFAAAGYIYSLGWWA